ncbi:hypothetical protein B0T16DRAFT_393452 [Cercophora newfieldiana]|uniref:Uncharacterized protein n=1 Tax=Cercophora newfieldiana TaxID=92897 RepID=A0AA39XVN4_9PEZI|nr:hypothetical protein B0T16DRAFT_393452 [Cercophora newfieldiana]
MKARYLQSVIGLVSLGVGSLALEPACLKDNSCVQSAPVQAKFFPEHKSQRVRVKYGPLHIPTAGTTHEMGNYIFPIPAPCTECVITEAVANLEYTDGKTANANNGMYLHHAVVFDNKTGSVSCPEAPGPVFASGNERTVVSISVNGTVKAGYHITKDVEFFAAIEIMNEGEPRDTITVIEYEFIPSIPADFKRAALVWLDVDGPCLQRGGEVPVPEGAKAFSLEMNPPWTSQLSGDVLQLVSHMHDGGDEQLVLRNGNVACAAKARYGEKPGYVSSGDHSNHGGGPVEGGGGGGHHDGHGFSPVQRRHEDIAHVSSISSCFKAGRVEIGDKWSVRANYNMTRYAPMNMGGHLEPVMGISMMYVALD